MNDHDNEMRPSDTLPAGSPIGDETQPLAGDRRARRPTVFGELESLAAPEGDGEYLAHFRIHEMVGRGAMGTVYRALDTLLDRQVAVKVLSERFDQHLDFQSRFVTEAKILARMNHPNIPQIHFIGKAGGRFFFAMEWIEGATVQDVAARGRLDEAGALGIVMQAAEALEVAHRAGIVHRDIKPSNLMITTDQVVKVLDFGLARSAADGKGADASGGFEGTPHYASPEQVRGAPLDARSDIYSLGLILHQLLAGRPPRSDQDITSALASGLVAPPPELLDDVECSPGSRSTLAWMLATEPDDRIPDCDTLIEALRDAYPEPPVAAAVANRVAAFLTDLLLAGLPLFVGFFAYWKVKGHFISTLLYDSVPGRVVLGAGLFVWLTLYPILSVRHNGQTCGQLLQRIRVSRRDGKPPSRRLMIVRTTVVWGPVCVAAGVQLDWPPALISSTAGSSAVIANLCWLWSLLWVILVSIPVVGRQRLSPTDWLSRTRVLRVRPALSRRATAEVDPGVRRRLAAARFVNSRVLSTPGVLLVWLALTVLAGIEIRSALPPNRWRVYSRHTMFEKVGHGDPGWDRLADRFLAGFLSTSQSTPDPTVLSFARHAFLPVIYAQPHPVLVVEDQKLGTESRHFGAALRGQGGAKSYLDGGTRSREAMEPSDQAQALRWNFARRVLYHGSFVHFVRALAHRRLTREGFEVLNPEAFVGLFRTEDDYILVAWPELRVHIPGFGKPQVVRLYHGWIRLSLDGETLSGSWGGSWHGGGLPRSVVADLAAEQDSAWGVTTESVDRILKLE